MTQQSMQTLDDTMPPSAQDAAKPDKTVEVTFTPPETWNFSPYRVTMGEKGVIKLKQVPANQNWAFTGAEVVKDTDKQFRHEPGGNHMLIHDDFKADGEWCYTVTVRTSDGTTYVSPDPQIVNQTPI
jgi:hypothetical protein